LDFRWMIRAGPQAQHFPHRGSSAQAAELEFAAALLPLWGFPRNADVALVDEQG
jgi:hypothetical protein